jgi:hypothetical protein
MTPSEFQPRYKNKQNLLSLIDDKLEAILGRSYPTDEERFAGLRRFLAEGVSEDIAGSCDSYDHDVLYTRLSSLCRSRKTVVYLSAADMDRDIDELRLRGRELDDLRDRHELSKRARVRAQAALTEAEHTFQ